MGAFSFFGHVGIMTPDRVVERLRSASRLASRFKNRVSMSIEQAARVLGVPTNADDTTITQAYRNKFKENRTLHPDAGGSAEAVTKLNVAKDTMLGVLAPDRGTPPRSYYQGKPNSSNPPPKEPEKDYSWSRDRQKAKPPEAPVPQPEGESFQSAISQGSAKWAFATEGRSYQQYVITSEKDAPERTGHWLHTRQYVLVGQNTSHYLVMLLTRVTHKGDEQSNTKTAWVPLLTSFPKSGKFLKIAPKVIKEIVTQNGDGYFRPVFKFYVFENPHPTENEVLKINKGRLSLKDALIGSGLVTEEEDSGLSGRKVQVELEPVFVRERYNSMDRGEWARRSDKAYDWFLYLNGKKSQLKPEEVDRMFQSHLLSSIFGYDYDKGKVNVTRIRGGFMKMDAADSLKLLAQALNSGPEKTTIEKML